MKIFQGLILILGLLWFATTATAHPPQSKAKKAKSAILTVTLVRWPYT